MECNKDEAIRAKEVAEQMLTKKDFGGAKKFAVKAQNLFPGLDGLSQLTEVVDIYAASEKKMNGEVDYYGVLSVDPSADDETIRKNYRRLALALHPDKNKSVGAEGAFKILSEAWVLLSDRTKRMAYDQKRSLMTLGAVNPSIRGGQNGFRNFTVDPSRSKNSATASFQPTRVVPQQSKPNTFWSICNACMIKYEYLNMYLNRDLVCPNCHRPFVGKEVSPPPVKGHASGVKLPTASNTWRTAPSVFGSKHGVNNHQAASNGQPVGENLKRPHEAAVNGLGSSSAQADRLTKKMRVNEQKQYSKRKAAVSQSAGKAGPGSQGNDKGVVQGSNKPRSSRELSQIEVRNMLAAKAKMEICKKLKEWSTTSVHKEVEKKQTPAAAACAQGFPMNDLPREETGNGTLVDSKKSSQQKKSSLSSETVHSEPEGTEIKTMAVPDSDFHNFDEDRAEKLFEDNQVWAAYDNDDGMPRYYALVHNVLGRKRFKIRISWLNSKTNSEFGPQNWVGSGFLKTSGDFRIGKHEISTTLNSFSHVVKWTKGAKGVIRIVPRKGDVWALYRNWSPKWSAQTPDEVIHKYAMVEVLEDYSEKEGVIIAPLIKVAGFKSVFHQHSDPKHIRSIPREEMFRFSHQVPSYLLTGKEAVNVPSGCRELDPAAMPLELLQVMTQEEIEEQQRKDEESSKLERPDSENQLEAKNGIGNVIKVEEATMDSESVAEKPILTYSRKNKGKKAGKNGESEKETSGAGAQPSDI